MMKVEHLQVATKEEYEAFKTTFKDYITQTWIVPQVGIKQEAEVSKSQVLNKGEQKLSKMETPEHRKSVEDKKKIEKDEKILSTDIINLEKLSDQKKRLERSKKKKENMRRIIRDYIVSDTLKSDLEKNTILKEIVKKNDIKVDSIE